RARGEIPDSLFGVGVPRRILVQPPKGKRVDVVASADDVALNIFYAPSMRNGAQRLPREDRGNAILSTLHLHNLEAIELPLETQRRVALVATIQGTTSEGTPWQLQLCDVHLDTRSGVLHGWRSFGGGRLSQAQALV